jgi:hypothetical protein
MGKTYRVQLKVRGTDRLTAALVSAYVRDAISDRSPLVPTEIDVTLLPKAEPQSGEAA